MVARGPPGSDPSYGLIWSQSPPLVPLHPPTTTVLGDKSCACGECCCLWGEAFTGVCPILSGLLSRWLDIPQHLPHDHSHDSTGFLGVVVQSPPEFKGSAVPVSFTAHCGSLFPSYFTDLTIERLRQLIIYTLECEHNSHLSTDCKTSNTPFL